MGSSVDFNSNSFNVTINAGATDGRANISVSCDAEVEGLETFDVKLILTSNVSGVTLGRDTSVGQIIDSTVQVSFSQSSYGVMEDDGRVTLVIALSQTSSVPFQVTVNTVGREDYNRSLMTVDVPAGMMLQTFMITIINNNIVECIKRFNVRITSVTSVTTCGVTVGNVNMSEVVITDDDSATVSLSQSQYSVAESDNSLSVIIMLSNRASEDVMVEVTLSDGSANAGVDYAMSSALVSTVAISAGSLTSSFDVDINNDMIQEDNETFSIAIRLLPSCLSLSLGTSSSTVTIIDNDVAMIIFSSSIFSGSESSGIISATVIISRGIVSSRDINVSITFTEGNATGNETDFNSIRQNVIIPAGANSNTVNIAVIDDNIVEGDETFTMNLNVPVSPGIIAGAVTVATATIIDTSTIRVSFTQSQFSGSETIGFVMVNLELIGGTSVSSFNVTVTPSEQTSVGAQGGVDFNTATLTATFASGMTVANVSVLVINDSTAEGNEEFDLMLSVPSSLSPGITAGDRNTAVGVIADSTFLVVEFVSGQFTGSESSGSIGVVVRITGGTSNTPITVTVTPTEQSPVSAMGSSVDFNSNSFTITINAGATDGRANISVSCDAEVEGLETFDVKLTLTSNISGVTLGRDTSVGQIVDSTVEVSFSQSSYEVMEDDGRVTLAIALSQTSSVPFQVTVNTVNVTAVDEEDYDGGVMVVNVPAGVMTQQFIISITNNSVVEYIETFNVTISSVTTCRVTIGNVNNGEVSIIDDDDFRVEFSNLTYSGTESLGVISVSINLLGGTANESLYVNISTLPGSALAVIDYDNTTQTAVFTAGSTVVTIAIPIINDTMIEGDETFMLTLKLLPTTRITLGTQSTATAIIIDTTPPQIYTHPMDRTVMIDNDTTSVTFTCAADGASSYFWQRDNGNISSNAEEIDNSTLTLKNILPSNNGHYQCVAENEYGRSYSNFALLTVEALPPVVTVMPTEIQVNEGERVEFNCSANGVGANDFKYQWFLNNNILVVGGNTSILVITSVSVDNIGNYTCSVTNSYGDSKESGMARLYLNQSCNAITEEYTDHGFSITWNETLVGVTVEAACTGTGLNGIVRRRCREDGKWDDEFVECFREATELFDQVANLNSSINELNETERIVETSRIANALVNITAPTQEPIFAADINSAVNIISVLNNIAETAIASLNNDDTFFEDTARVIDNLLSEANQDSWKQLENNSSTSQDLLIGAEQLTNLLSKTLTSEATKATQIMENIVIKAERVSNDEVEGYVFPDDDDDLSEYTGGTVQLMVPSGLLQDINATELTMAITVIRNNTGLTLPSSNNGNGIAQIPASAIFSLQMDPLPNSSILEKNPIMMMFDVDVAPSTVDDVTCNFYDYTMNSNDFNQIGSWSTEGLTVDKNNSNKTSVTCLTTHLTSFAILTSMQDEQPPSTDMDEAEDESLPIIIYIGCVISLVCLCVSIITLSCLIFKTKEKISYLFIHLNLCFSLALGLVAFIAGIERANDDEVACKVVAALLQYFFISGFCWMLCEVVFLYMVSVTVCGNKLNKLIFFFILGWGPAVPIVAVSAGIAHEHYMTDHYCWIESDDGTIFAFIGPIAVIMLIASVFLAITLKALCVNRRKVMSEETESNRETTKDLLKAATVVLPLLGVTWIIGILAVNDDTQVFEWIFAVFNALQGISILIFYVLMGNRGALRVCCNCIRSNQNGMGMPKEKASQDGNNEAGGHNKKITGVDYLSPTLEKSLLSKSEELEDTVCEDNNQIKLTTFRRKEELMMERYDAEGQNSDEDKNGGNKEEKRSITDEVIFAAQTGAIKPTPFPRNAK